MKVTPEQFVATWSRARTCGEVAVALKMKPSSVRARASAYRSRGVKLKHMANGKPVLDVARLNALAAKRS